MDFIKTSSLRALIELTFQRKWNGLIWMSRKGVIAKRVKTVQTALSRISANRAERLAEERMFRVSAKTFRPSEVSAKVRTGRRITTRETCPAVGQATTSRHAAHDHAARAGNKASRPRNLLAYHGRCIRPSRERTSHVRPRNHRPNPSSVRPHRPTVKSSGHDRSDTPRPDCPADRPDRPSERRGRPEAVFEAQSAQFKPKAGADLARLGLAAFSYLVHYKYFFLAL
ncbi:unnamed protein product [Microthlaspi erraticum]|uniref:Uncharacterized protein n=1 Tax=Microthlaspi erraticum TaxID=1685480 RepID=A0A6D2IGF1_9BRAS|nr:unnamed protein product [Microthlaspi erraticum]